MLIRRALIAAAVVLSARTAAAQTQQVAISYVPTVRLDLLGGHPTALQAGAGIAFPLSNYFSIGGALGAGISSTGFSGRGDLFGQFSLDPYHQYPWATYVGGGATVRADGGGAGTRSYLLGFVGVNGPRAGRVAPGIELGFGGGVRLGVTLRWAGASPSR